MVRVGAVYASGKPAKLIFLASFVTKHFTPCRNGKGKDENFFFKMEFCILYFVISLLYSLETSIIKNTLRNLQHILVLYVEHFQHGLKEKN